jgi:arsenate reductase (thioredoxin)
MQKNIKILILCTGNACRSQMAEGILKSFDNIIEVHSAGISPADRISSITVKVLKEIGIDISSNYPKSVSNFINDEFDFVISVCDNANQECPVFAGKVLNRLHIPFDDPYMVKGSEEEILVAYRRIRDEIMSEFIVFYNKYIKEKNY